jgi:putative phosphoesterase
MTKLAIISDVHADAEALKEALARIAAMGIERIVCAGDLVDYGKFPEKTIALLAEKEIPCIRGNHDRWALDAEKAGDPDLVLSHTALAFLRRLPTKLDLAIDGIRIAVRHARPGSDMQGIAPDVDTPDQIGEMLRGCAADVLIVGHTHRPFCVTAPDGGVAVNPGALLRDPRKATARAMVLDPKSGSWSEDEGISAPGTFGVLELPSLTFEVFRAGDGTKVEPIRVGGKGAAV